MVLILYGAWPILLFVVWPMVKTEARPGPDRESIISRLKDGGGRHLVLVRDGHDHSVHEEWVYNEADIDRAVGRLGERPGGCPEPAAAGLLQR